MKEVIGTYRSTANSLVDRQSNITVNERDKLEGWREYVGELFENKTEILLENMTSKNRKAVGPDEIPKEIIKLVKNNGNHSLLNLLNKICESGNIPKDWLLSTFIMMPKEMMKR